MKKTSILLLTILVGALGTTDTFAQSKKKKTVDKDARQEKSASQNETAPAPAEGLMKSDGGFIALEAGSDYRIIVDAPGDVYPDYGDYLEIHLNTMAGDSVIFDTRDAMGNGEPAPLQLQKSPFKGDLLEALKK